MALLLDGVSGAPVQPQGALRIDWSNPILRGLGAIWTPALLKNPVSGRPFTNLAVDRPLVYSPVGVGKRWNGSGGGEIVSDCPASNENTFLIVVANCSGSLGRPCTTSDGVGGHDLYMNGVIVYQEVYSTTNGQWDCGETGSSTTPVAFAVASYGDGTDPVFFTNGYKRGTHLQVTPSGSFVAGSNFYVGDNSAGTRPLTGSVFLAARFTRRLAEQELVSLTANPWQVFTTRVLWPKVIPSLLAPELSAARTHSRFRRRATAQPQQTPRIDWENPITRGMHFAFVPHQNINLINGVGPSSVIAGYSLENTGQGKGIRSATDGTNCLTWNDDKSTSPAPSPRTMLMILRSWASFSTSNYMMQLSGIGSAGTYFTLRSTGFSLGYDLTASTSYNGNPFATSAQDYTKEEVVAAVQRADFNAEIWRNGVLAAGPTAQPGLPDFASYGGANLILGDHSPMMLLCLWNRDLSPSELGALGRNPWQVFSNARYEFSAIPVAVSIADLGIYLPGSDMLTSGWTAVPSGSFASVLNEQPIDDATYAQSPLLTPTTAPLIENLSSPVPAGTRIINVRCKASGTCTLRVTLLDNGGASVGAAADTSINSTFTLYSLPVTTTGAAYKVKIEVLGP